MKALVQKWWVTKRRSITDTRVVYVPLSRQSKALALEIKKQVRRVNATLSEQDRNVLGTILKDSRASTLAPSFTSLIQYATLKPFVVRETGFESIHRGGLMLIRIR